MANARGAGGALLRRGLAGSARVIDPLAIPQLASAANHIMLPPCSALWALLAPGLFAHTVFGVPAAYGPLDVRDFGAVGDGVCVEAPDRSWTKCSGRDESAALQRAIDAAQQQARTLYVPAGVYMVNSSLIVRKPSENASIAKPQPYVTAGLRIIGEGMADTIIVAQCR